MILIEVTVPVISQRYDFSVDENRPVRESIREMRQIISRKLREEFIPEAGFELLSPLQRRPLPPDSTLSECGIHDGAELILV